MAFPDEGSGEPVYHGMYWGLVLHNKDPEKLGRVRAQVPGLVGETAWAMPVGSPGAGKLRRGLFAVPETGSTVLIGFVRGDIDEPIYWPGPWPVGSVPSAVLEQTVDNAPSVRSLETETFEIVIYDTPTERKLVLRTRRTGDKIEINALDNSVTITATASLNIFAVGIVDISADGGVQIQGRPVIPSLTGKPI